MSWEIKKEQGAPRIRDFLWEWMIKKISPSISSGVLVGRNSTLLTQIDYSYLPPAPPTPHSDADGLKKQGGRKMWTYCSTTKESPAKYGVRQSAYTISCQSLWRWWEVGVCLAELSRCHQRSEQGGDGEANGKWWHCDSCQGTGGGDERAVSRKSEDAYASRGGRGPFGGPAVNSFWFGRGIN